MAKALPSFATTTDTALESTRSGGMPGLCSDVSVATTRATTSFRAGVIAAMSATAAAKSASLLLTTSMPTDTSMTLPTASNTPSNAAVTSSAWVSVCPCSRSMTCTATASASARCARVISVAACVTVCSDAAV